MDEKSGSMEGGAQTPETAAATETATEATAGSAGLVSQDKTQTGTATQTNVLPDDFGEQADNWEDEAIYPEGYQEGDSLVDSSGEDPLGLFSKKPEEGQQGSQEETPDKQPEVERQAEQTDEEPDYKALYEAMQKEREAEKAQAEDKAGKEKYRQIYEKLTTKDGMPDEVARSVAKDMCGGKSYPLSGEEESDGEKAASTESGTADFREQLHRIATLFPDAKEMPQEVSAAVLKGEDAVSAYAAWRVKESEKTVAELRQENAILRQNQKNRENAVIRPTTGGSAVKEEPDDPFLRGLLEDW